MVWLCTLTITMEAQICTQNNPVKTDFQAINLTRAQIFIKSLEFMNEYPCPMQEDIHTTVALNSFI